MLKSYRVTIQRFVSLGSTLYAQLEKKISPRFRFKIKASYSVSTEGDVRRVTVLAIEAA